MIETEKDAIEYIKKVHDALFYLAILSSEAGLNKNASVFHTLIGSFGDPEEWEKLQNIIYKYNMDAMKRLGMLP